mgnify:CR=1 FL=1
MPIEFGGGGASGCCCCDCAQPANASGNIITNNGANLMGYPTSPDGTRLSFDSQPLRLPTGGPIPARQTANSLAEFNLDARAPVASTQTPPTPLSK